MTPARLHKENRDDVSPLIICQNKVEAWVLSHATLCLTIMLIVLMTLFIALAYALVGVSATGDTIYNGMEAVI